MPVGERVLRLVILTLYALSLSDMLWTGRVYRFASSVMVPFFVAAAGFVWLIAIPVAWRLVAARGEESTQTDSGWDLWMRGMLYAVFALPPVVYLIGR